MSSPASRAAAGVDLAALDAITEAVESGAGLPDVVRAASRALERSLALIDAGGTVLAVAARSSADERALLDGGEAIERLALRVGDEVVGELRLRARGEAGPALRYVSTLIASEVGRVRGPERASEQAAESFVAELLAGGGQDAGTLIARGRELGLDVAAGGTVLVVRAHPFAPVEEGWRRRFLAAVERGARTAPGAMAVLRGEPPGAEAAVLLPGADEPAARRAGDALLRELEATLTGCRFALGRSRPAGGPGELAAAASEALLAANVAEGDPERTTLGFEETGAYRILLSALSQDPAEVERFYQETVAPLAAYDEQYETQLVRTLEAFLEADGNVANTAQRLFTHRHTIRYRLERVRDLSGLDVGSSDGREKLSLGLKAMRVLGLGAPGGPATEAGAEGGRVPRAR